MGQNNKKRKFKPVPEVEIRVDSKKITFDSHPDLNLAYCKFNNSHYIFQIDTGVVIFQGVNYTDVRNRVKQFLETGDVKYQRR